MEMAPGRISLASRNLILTILLLFVFVTSSKANTSADSEGFSYELESPTGPAHWGKLQKEWATCGEGAKQSPVDIMHKATKNMTADLGPLEYSYKPCTVTVENHGREFGIALNGGDRTLVIEGKEYVLKKAHWHLPSEHTFNGTRYDMEMHMVHESSDKKKAVVAVLYAVQEGNVSKLVQIFEPYFKKVAGKEGAEANMTTPINPTTWLNVTSGYYRYEGSLTTPPCTEGVIWTVMSKVRAVSKEQVDLMKSASSNPKQINARPVQKTNNRVVGYFQGCSKKA